MIEKHAKTAYYFFDWIWSISAIEAISYIDPGDNETKILVELFKMLAQVSITVAIVFKYFNNKNDNKNDS